MTTGTARAPEPVRYSLEEDEGRCALVAGLMMNDPEAVTFLHEGMVRGLRFYFGRHLGAAYRADYIHETLFQAVQQIQQGGLGNPGELVGFLRTIAMSKVAQVSGVCALPFIEEPRKDAMPTETRVSFRKALEKMNSRDREILDRYYRLAQSQEQICREMNLKGDEFQRLKARSKARLDSIGQDAGPQWNSQTAPIACEDNAAAAKSLTYL